MDFDHLVTHLPYGFTGQETRLGDQGTGDQSVSEARNPCFLNLLKHP